MKDKLEIISLPHPALRRPSRKIGLINEEVRSLIEKMTDQAIMWESDRPNETTVGLAAVQINQLLKVVIIRENFDSDKEPVFQTLINPKITKYGGAKTIKLEGCLSVPDFYANVERYEEVRVSALDERGNPIKFKASGFLARIIQHEVDHLKGIMTVDRAVEAINDQGEKFSFCRLAESGKFEVADEAEVAASRILRND
ncbi:peptide deformylase [Candidatus Saccharibacteria bacterium]|nr:peptide deformylase [Candidatus Saccharibacteria bacterium]